MSRCRTTPEELFYKFYKGITPDYRPFTGFCPFGRWTTDEVPLSSILTIGETKDEPRAASFDTTPNFALQSADKAVASLACSHPLFRVGRDGILRYAVDTII